MANIIFTNQCNIRCPFCFAVENNYSKETNTKKDFFSIEKTWEISRFLKNKEFRFCGGEPTQNPNIISAINLLLKDEFRIFIMTNGIWGDSFLKYIKSLSNNQSLKIHYLFNILEKSFYSEDQLKTLNSVFESINSVNVKIGFTIYKKQQNYDYIIHLANKYNIKYIRVSVAAPYITSGEYLLQKNFNLIANDIHQLVLKCYDMNILVVGDCGSLPPCYYNDEQFRDITLLSAIKSLSCKYSAVDIDYAGNAWRCYGLYPVLRQKTNNFVNDEELGKYFDRRIKMLKNLYLFNECKTCKYWYKSCTGGCHAVRIKKALEKKPDLCLFPIDDDEEVLQCIPKLSDKLVIKNRNDKLITQTIYKPGGVINNPDENTYAFLKEIDGKKKISDLISLWKSNFSGEQNARNTIVNKCRELFELDLIDLEYDYKYEPDNKLD